MRVVNPMRTRRRAIDDLSLTIRCLPRATRLAMLEGISTNPIIVGAYSNREGICPMLAAHRAGGRTNLIAFAEAWDRFAQNTRRFKRARRASERELLVLRSHLEASLIEDLEAPPLATAIADHQELLARQVSEQRPRPARTWGRVFLRYDEFREAIAELEALGEVAEHRAPATGARA